MDIVKSWVANDLFFSVAPILFLIYIMTRKNSVPSQKALPLVALIMYCIKLGWFGADPNQVHASVLGGLLSALTPISIVWGAIFLFKTMEHSGALETIRVCLNRISGNRIAQVMLVAWAFGFLIEGASGFGTPAALAAPILVGLGVRPFQAAVVCLVFNSVPVSFGAVGTPTWYGFSTLKPVLTDSELSILGVKTALLHTVVACVLPLFALRVVAGWQEIRKNIVYIYLSVFSCVIPYLVLSWFSYEFPSILGGAIGLPVSAWLASRNIGLEKEPAPHVPLPPKVVSAFFPLWGTVLILILTRIPQLGIKALISSSSGGKQVALGSFGMLKVSPSLSVTLEGILGTATSWTHKLLYVPSLVPFFLVAGISVAVLGMSRKSTALAWSESWHRMKNPIMALMGALVFVKLLMMGGENSCVMLIGRSLASNVGGAWVWCAPYMGALGSFFSGSNTVSNLTFGGIQDSVAMQLGLSRTTVLALQSVGGAMGNMVCIHNIVAVCSILGLEKSEGLIIKKTVLPMVVYGLIAALMTVLAMAVGLTGS